MIRYIFLTLFAVLSFSELYGQEAFKIQGSALQYSYGKSLVRVPGKWLVIDNTYVRFGIPTPPRALKLHWISDSLQLLSSNYISYGSYYQLPGLSVYGKINHFDSFQIIITGTQWAPGSPSSLYMVSLLDTAGNLKGIKYLSVSSGYYYPGSEPLVVSADLFMFVASPRTTNNEYLYLMDTSFACRRVWAIQTPYSDYGIISNLHIQDSFIVGIFSPSEVYNGPTGCSGFAFMRIDTTNLSANGVWHYVKPTTPMYPYNMLLLHDSTYLVVGTVLDTCFTSARRRAFAMRLRPDGTVVWTRRFMVSSGGSETFYSAIDNMDGTYVLVGEATTWSPTGDKDIFLMRIDSAGNIIKAVSIGNTGTDVIYDIAMISPDNFLLTGSVDNDPGDNSDAFTPFVMHLDTSFVVPCLNMNWIDVTSSIYIDSSYYDTTTVYSITVAACPSWQNQPFSPVSYTDSAVLLRDTMKIFTDTIVHARCYGDSGYIAVYVTGGQYPYTFMWNNQPSISDDVIDTLQSLAGTYNVFAIDVTGCYSDTITLTINQPSPISISVDSLKDVACYGDSTGEAFVSVSGGTAPYSVWWSTNDSALFISGVPAGTYTVYVLDSASCLDSLTITIDQPPLLSVTIDTTNIPTLQSLASGGTPPYSYLWSTGETSQAITVSQSGQIHVELTDSNGCLAYDTVFIMIQAIEKTHEQQDCKWTLIDKLTLHITCPQVKSISLFTLTGKLIAVYHEQTLTLPGSGTYLAQITSNSRHIYTFKIIVP